MSIVIGILLVVHVIISLLMVLAVLMQLPRSEGLGAAFGGGVAENVFGAQTTHVLAKFTVWLGIAFFAVTLALAMAYARENSAKSSIQRELMSSPAVPAATPALEPAATPESNPAATPDANAAPTPVSTETPDASVGEVSQTAVTETATTPSPTPSPSAN